MEVLYQLNRGWTGMNNLIKLLRTLKYDIQKGTSVSDLRTLYLLIPYCRDIFRGKGERDLAYRLIYAFYQVFPVLAIKAIHMLFQVREGLPMVGSWCDIKYFCVFVERNSPWGADDPLIAIMASIANKNIDNNQVAKWIPRESHHPDLFSVFARDFFTPFCGVFDAKSNGSILLNSVKKGLYRKRVSRSSKETNESSVYGFPTWFMGKYVCHAVKLIQEGTITGERIEVLEGKWRRLLKTFPHFNTYGLPIIDLDINILDDVLFHSIGFACLISEKMGLKRIMLAGGVPTWVDISVCHGFVDMVRVLWSHCHGRGVSRLGDAIHLVEKAFKFVFDNDLFIFIFSERFAFDWRSLILSGKCMPVFWNMGTTFEIPVDLYIQSDIDNRPIYFIYMSGYASGLLTPFFSNDLRVNEFYTYVLESYHEWSLYFDLFISNISLPFGTIETIETIGTTVSTPEVEDKKEMLEIPNNLSLEQI